MACCQIRQGQDGHADEDIKDLAGQPKPQRRTNSVVSWIGWVNSEERLLECVLEKKSKPSVLRERISG